MNVFKSIRQLPPLEGFIVLHLILPLVPFFLGALMRTISYPMMRWNILDASELSLSMGLVTVFVAQNLWTTALPASPIMNDDKKEELEKEAHKSIIYSICFICLFAAVEIFNTIVNDRQDTDYEPSLHLAQICIFLLTGFAIRYIVRTQRSYKLKARL